MTPMTGPSELNRRGKHDLKSSNCNVEARRMGHCGGDDRASLYSLRQRQQDGVSSKSYVTIAYNNRSKEIFQIKGKFKNSEENISDPKNFLSR